MTTMLLQPHHHHLVSMNEAMNSLLEASFVRPYAEAGTSSTDRGVPVDIWQTEDELVVRAAVPGFAPDEINLVVLNGVLTLKGEHRQAEADGQGQYLRHEISLGVFERSFELPFAVQADKAHADFEHGILTVSLPTAEDARAQAIKIGAGKAIDGQKVSE
ncbi:MAG: Hsp20/alpha crystallin family protein [Chloroflexota bacterium]